MQWKALFIILLIINNLACVYQIYSICMKNIQLQMGVQEISIFEMVVCGRYRMATGGIADSADMLLVPNIANEAMGKSERTRI